MILSCAPLSFAYLNHPDGTPYSEGNGYTYGTGDSFSAPTDIWVDTYGTTEVVRLAAGTSGAEAYSYGSGSNYYVVATTPTGVPVAPASAPNMASVGESASLPVVELKIHGVSDASKISFGSTEISSNILAGETYSHVSGSFPAVNTSANTLTYRWQMTGQNITCASGPNKDVIYTITFSFEGRTYTAYAYSETENVYRPGGGKISTYCTNGWGTLQVRATNLMLIYCAQTRPGWAAGKKNERAFVNFSGFGTSGNTLTGMGSEETFGSGASFGLSDNTYGSIWGRAMEASGSRPDPDQAISVMGTSTDDGNRVIMTTWIDKRSDHLGQSDNGSGTRTNGLNFRVLVKNTDAAGSHSWTSLRWVYAASGLAGSNNGTGPTANGTATELNVRDTNITNTNAITNNGTNVNGINGNRGYVGSAEDKEDYFSAVRLKGNGPSSSTDWSIDIKAHNSSNGSATVANYTADHWVDVTMRATLRFRVYDTTKLYNLLTAIDSGTVSTAANTYGTGLTVSANKGICPQQSQFTAASWSTFKTAYDNARNAIADFDMDSQNSWSYSAANTLGTEQTTVDNRVSALVNAYNGLSKIDPSTKTITVHHVLKGSTPNGSNYADADKVAPSVTYYGFDRSTGAGIKTQSAASGKAFVAGTIANFYSASVLGYRPVTEYYTNLTLNATSSTWDIKSGSNSLAPLGQNGVIVFYYEPTSQTLIVNPRFNGHSTYTNENVLTGQDINGTSGGATELYSSIYDRIGATYVNPNDPTDIRQPSSGSYAHYNLDGLYYMNANATGTSPYLAGDLTTSNATKLVPGTSFKMPYQTSVLFAKWAPKPVKIQVVKSYDPSNPVVIDASATTPVMTEDPTYQNENSTGRRTLSDVTFSQVADPNTNPDYTFIGFYDGPGDDANIISWPITATYDTVEGGDDTRFEIQEVAGTNDKTNLVTIYAKYQNLAGTIYFEPNGGTMPEGYGNTLSFQNGDNIAYPVPTRNGYTFGGWVYDRDVAATANSSNAVPGWTTTELETDAGGHPLTTYQYVPVKDGNNDPATITMNTNTGFICYATWIPNYITVTFRLAIPATERNQFNSPDTDNYPYYRITVKADQQISPSELPGAPRRMGWAFDHWVNHLNNRTLNVNGKWPLRNTQYDAFWVIKDDTASVDLTSYVTISGTEKKADIQSSIAENNPDPDANPDFVLPTILVAPDDIVNVRFCLSGTFYSGSTAFIFGYNKNVYEPLPSETSCITINENNKYISGIGATNGGPTVRVIDPAAWTAAGHSIATQQFVNPTDSTDVETIDASTTGILMITIDPDLSKMEEYKTVAMDDSSYILNIKLRVRDDAEGHYGSVWLATDQMRSHENYAGDMYVSSTTGAQDLTNEVYTAEVKFDEQVVMSTVALEIDQPRPKSIMTIKLPEDGQGNMLGTINVDNYNNSLGVTLNGAAGTEIYDLTDDNGSFSYTYNNDTIYGMPEISRPGYHISHWYRLDNGVLNTQYEWIPGYYAEFEYDANDQIVYDGSGHSGQSGYTYSFEWEPDEYTYRFFLDEEMTSQQGSDYTVTYLQNDFTAPVPTNTNQYEYVGWCVPGMTPGENDLANGVINNITKAMFSANGETVTVGNTEYIYKYVIGFGLVRLPSSMGVAAFADEANFTGTNAANLVLAVEAGDQDFFAYRLRGRATPRLNIHLTADTSVPVGSTAASRVRLTEANQEALGVNIRYGDKIIISEYNTAEFGVNGAPVQSYTEDDRTVWLISLETIDYLFRGVDDSDDPTFANRRASGISKLSTMTSTNVTKYVPYALYRETIETGLYSTITPEVNTAQTYVMASVPAGNDGEIYIRYMGAVVKESWAKSSNIYTVKYTVTGDQLAAAGLFNDTVGSTAAWSTYQRIGSVFTGFDTVVVPTLSAPYGYGLPSPTHSHYASADTGNIYGTQVTISGNDSSTTVRHALSRPVYENVTIHLYDESGNELTGSIGGSTYPLSVAFNGQAKAPISGSGLPTKTGHSLTGWTPMAYESTGWVPDQEYQTTALHAITGAVNISGNNNGYFSGLSEETAMKYVRRIATTTDGVTTYEYHFYLKAAFTPNNYPVTYYVDGVINNNLTPSSNIAYGSDFTLAPAQTKTGYTFSGWYLYDTTNQTYDETNQFVPGATQTMSEEGYTFGGYFTANSYNVVFNNNDGTATPATQTKATVYDAAITAPDTVPTRNDGYVFKGWALDASATTPDVAYDGSAYAAFPALNATNFASADFSTTGADVVTYYAVWEEDVKDYNIEFWYEGADGTFAVDSTRTITRQERATQTVTITPATDAEIMAAAIASGEADIYEYIGGVTGEVLTGVVPATGTLTLKVYVSRKSYALKTDVDGTITTVGTYKAGADLSSVTIADPTKAGYFFAGWEPAKPATMPAAETTLLATWTPEVYTIAFDINGAQGTAPANIIGYRDGNGVAQLVYMGATVTLPDPTNAYMTGYKFTGWYEEAACTTAFTGANIGDLGNDGAVKTLYAKWEKDSFKFRIVDDIAGTDIVAETPVEYQADITGYQNLSALTLTGYENPHFTTTPETTMPARDYTLHVTWDKASFEIEYDLAGGSFTGSNDHPASVEYEAALPAPAAEKTGFSAASPAWKFYEVKSGDNYTNEYTGSTMPAYKLYAVAQWAVNPYTVTYAAGTVDIGTVTGNVPAAVTQDYNTTFSVAAATGLTAAGYTFAGWKSTLDGNTYEAGDTYTIAAADDTLTAQWTIDTYTISFNMNGADSAQIEDISRTYNTSVAKPADPTKAGYEFGGWYIGSTDNEANKVTWPYTITGDVEMTAKWVAHVYNVVYNLNDSAAVKTSSWTAAAFPTSVTYAPGATLALPVFGTDFTNAGYETAAWTASSGTISGNTLSIAALPNDGDTITLTANYDAQSYDISFYYGSTQVGGSTVNVTLDYLDPIPAAVKAYEYELTGYTFGGWYDNSGLTGAAYIFPDTMPAGNITLYAKMTAIDYTVKFALPDSASGEPAFQNGNFYDFDPLTNEKINIGDGVSQLPTIPTSAADQLFVEFYDFIGWSTTPGGATITLGNEAGAWTLTAAVIESLGGTDIVFYPVYERVDVELDVTSVINGVVVEDTVPPETNFIYMENFSKKKEADVKGAVDVIGDGEINVIPSKGTSCGTGTKIEIFDNVAQAVTEVYYIVLFGDVEGNSVCNSVDIDRVKDRIGEGGEWTFRDGAALAIAPTVAEGEAILARCYDRAADTDGDCDVDSTDYENLTLFTLGIGGYEFTTGMSAGNVYEADAQDKKYAFIYNQNA